MSEPTTKYSDDPDNTPQKPGRENVVGSDEIGDEEDAQLPPMPNFSPKDYAKFSRKICAEEAEIINARRKNLDISRVSSQPPQTKINEDDGEKNPFIVPGLVGLALSGGGIRSATFSLGVMQALAEARVMKHVDILSTVSGGGYIGSALTWWCSDKTGTAQKNTDDKFPFGAGDTAGMEPPPHKKSDSWQLIRFLRSHGNYLTPGRGLDLFSGGATFLRGLLLNLLVWLPLVAVISSIVQNFGWIEKVSTYAEHLAIFCGALLVLSYIGYSIATYQTGRAASKYSQRRKFERGCGLLLGLLILALAIYFIFAFYEFAAGSGTNAATNGSANSSYLAQAQTLLSKGWWGILAVGLFTAILSFKRESTAVAGAMLWSGLILVMLGLLSGAYDLGIYLEILAQKLASAETTSLSNFWNLMNWAPEGLVFALFFGFVFYGTRPQYKKFVKGVLSGALFIFLMILTLAVYRLGLSVGEHELAIIWATATLFSLVLGTYVNINYISLHRFYRDRLMETFMPDPSSVSENKTAPPATLADGAVLSDFTKITGTNNDHIVSPYHIVNTNLILVNSDTPKFKERNGDNFVLSPLYCGGNAVGWQRTKEFMGNRLTLATAVAISGAAANPNAHVSGEGLGTNRIVGFLMALLNIRLGNWVPNPGIKARYQSIMKPNHFWPAGIYEFSKLFGLNLGFRENSLFVEISDGGHFENTGMYELLRRRSALIICCDGGADSKFTFSDLYSCLSRAREDFGIEVKVRGLDLGEMIPSKEWQSFPNKAKFTKKSHFVADIIYPNGIKGKMVFIKTALVDHLTFPTLAYRGGHSDFPDESTADQFFDSDQFDAYRDLGYKIGKSVTDDQNLISGGTLEKYIRTL